MRRDVLLGTMFVLLLSAFPSLFAAPPDGNRLAYLDEVESLLSPQGFPQADHAPVGRRAGRRGGGGAGDRRHARPGRYEAYLRPILNRLKAIDGRAPVSIMTNQVDPRIPGSRRGSRRGCRSSATRSTHPCPLLAEGRFRRGGRDLSRLRRPDEQDPRQQAGRLPDALLRLDQHASARGSSPRSSTRRARRAISSRSTRRSSPSSRPTTRACPATWSSTPTARSGSASTSRFPRS